MKNKSPLWLVVFYGVLELIWIAICVLNFRNDAIDFAFVSGVICAVLCLITFIIHLYRYLKYNNK